MKKVLLITGIHPDEKYSRMVCEQFVSMYSYKYDIDVIDLGISSDSRTVEFNLNRLSDISELLHVAEKLQRILEYPYEYDIILDVHNSKDIRNCILFSNYSNKFQLYVPKYNVNWVSNNIIHRRVKFNTISSYLRESFKLNAYTIEINRMNSSGVFTKDVKFLNSCVENLKRAVLSDSSLMPDTLFPTLNNSNEMYLIKFKHEIDNLETFDNFVVTKSQIEGIWRGIDDKSILNELFINNSTLTVNIVGAGKDSTTNNSVIECTIKQ